MSERSDAKARWMWEHFPTGYGSAEWTEFVSEQLDAFAQQARDEALLAYISECRRCSCKALEEAALRLFGTVDNITGKSVPEIIRALKSKPADKEAT